MSKTLRGNLTGALIAILGCLAGYGAYRIEFEWGMVIGVLVALFGATIVNPTAVKEGANDFKGSVGEVIDSVRKAKDAE